MAVTDDGKEAAKAEPELMGEGVALGHESKVEERLEEEEEIKVVTEGTIKEGVAVTKLLGCPEIEAIYVGVDTIEAEVDAVLLREISEGV